LSFVLGSIQRRLEEARRYLARISKQWDDALGRLKNFVEE